MNLYETANNTNVAVADLAKRELMRYQVAMLRLTGDEVEQVAAQTFGQNMTRDQVANVIRNVTGREVNLVERKGHTWIQADWAE